MKIISTYPTFLTRLHSCYKTEVAVIILFCLLVQPVRLLAAEDARQSVLNCTAQNEPLVANYTIQRMVTTRKRKSFASETPNDLVSPIKLSTQQVELTREGDETRRVVHTYPDINQSEVWNRTRNGYMRLVKHFNAHARAIEYEPVDIGSPTIDVGWNQKFHLLPSEVHEQLIKSMAGNAVSTDNCVYQFEYENKEKGLVIDVEWNQKMQLPQRMVVLQTDQRNRQLIIETRTTINLKSSDVNAELVERKFKDWDKHLTLDFADIGDNESDPFVMTMINFGFIKHGALGFYDSSGQQLSQ